MSRQKEGRGRGGGGEGERRGGGEGEGVRGRGSRESGLSSINTSFIRPYYPTGPGSPMHFTKAPS